MMKFDIQFQNDIKMYPNFWSEACMAIVEIPGRETSRRTHRSPHRKEDPWDDGWSDGCSTENPPASFYRRYGDLWSGWVVDRGQDRDRETND